MGELGKGKIGDRKLSDRMPGRLPRYASGMVSQTGGSVSAMILPVTSKNNVPTGRWQWPSRPGVDYGIVPQIHSLDAKGCGNELVIKTNLQLNGLKHYVPDPPGRHIVGTRLIYT